MNQRPHDSRLYKLFLGSLLLLLAYGCGPKAPEQTVTQTPPPKQTPTELDKPRILVMGVTGRQGSALAKMLVDMGYPVRGTTRNPSSGTANSMQSLGIEVVQADFTDRPSLDRAATGVYGMFFYTPVGPQEVAMGKNIIDSAVASGVKHIIYSTSLSADPENGFPDGSPKREVEDYLRSIGIGFTIFRPAPFMENFAGQQASIFSNGITGPQSPEYVSQYISVNDIAFFAATAFEKPGEWIGAELNIASDEMTQAELAELFAEVMGQPVSYQQTSWDEAAKRMPERLVKIFRWYESSGFKVDVDTLRASYPNLSRLEEYLRSNAWEGWAPIEEE